jgi:diadenosine tetraphosphate (Ap4A) HIT family hydrolase
MNERLLESKCNHRCIFCGSIPLEPRIIESEHFSIVADVAPIAESHMLLFPRFHTHSLADLPAGYFEELELLLATLVRSQIGRTHRLYLYEHGRAPICTSNNGPTHAHAHILGLRCELASLLNGKTGEILDVTTLSGLRNLSNVTGEYLLWGSCNGPYKIAGIYQKLPKRFLRMALTDAIVQVSC